MTKAYLKLRNAIQIAERVADVERYAEQLAVFGAGATERYTARRLLLEAAYSYGLVIANAVRGDA